MWGFNKAPDAETGGPKETEPEVISQIEKIARQAADEQLPEANLTSTEIHQMAELLAVHAEESGEPLDMEAVESPDFKERIMAGLGARIDMRGTPQKTYALGSDGVLGEANSPAELQRISEMEREQQDKPSDA